MAARVSFPLGDIKLNDACAMVGFGVEVESVGLHVWTSELHELVPFLRALAKKELRHVHVGGDFRLVAAYSMNRVWKRTQITSKDEQGKGIFYRALMPCNLDRLTVGADVVDRVVDDVFKVIEDTQTIRHLSIDIPPSSFRKLSLVSGLLPNLNEYCNIRSLTITMTGSVYSCGRGITEAALEFASRSRNLKRLEIPYISRKIRGFDILIEEPLGELIHAIEHSNVTEFMFPIFESSSPSLGSILDTLASNRRITTFSMSRSGPSDVDLTTIDPLERLVKENRVLNVLHLPVPPMYSIEKGFGKYLWDLFFRTQTMTSIGNLFRIDHPTLFSNRSTLQRLCARTIRENSLDVSSIPPCLVDRFMLVH